MAVSKRVHDIAEKLVKSKKESKVGKEIAKDVLKKPISKKK